MVQYGTVVPDGFLPVFSVDTEEEAEQLLVLCCGRNLDGDFVADELLEEQTIPNLLRFGERLERVWEEYFAHG